MHRLALDHISGDMHERIDGMAQARLSQNELLIRRSFLRPLLLSFGVSLLQRVLDFDPEIEEDQLANYHNHRG